LGPISDSAALSVVWSAALRSLVPRGVDKTVFFSVLFPGTRSFEGRRCCSVSCSERGDEMRPIAKSGPVSIFWRPPPNSGSVLGLFPAGCAIPSSSLSCSNDEPCRHGPCSSFRSSEEPHSGFTTVVLGCLTRASLGVLPVGCLRAPAVARVGVVGPTRAMLPVEDLIRGLEIRIVMHLCPQTWGQTERADRASPPSALPAALAANIDRLL
jgi:hypothetical protein